MVMPVWPCGCLTGKNMPTAAVGMAPKLFSTPWHPSLKREPVYARDSTQTKHLAQSFHVKPAQFPASTPDSSTPVTDHWPPTTNHWPLHPYSTGLMTMPLSSFG
jgi:hypothetical protein